MKHTINIIIIDCENAHYEEDPCSQPGEPVFYSFDNALAFLRERGFEKAEHEFFEMWAHEDGHIALVEAHPIQDSETTAPIPWTFD